jgi:acetylornithine/N-succinyldiaminopimelate aminotransferase
MSTASQDRYAAALMNTFGPPQLVLTRGKGAHVWDEDGQEYVDLLGGIAVNVLGHAHPAVVQAVTTQLETLGHVSNFFATAPQITLAERLLDLTSPSQVGEVAAVSSRRGKVFFTNSGTEANEAALKLTRRTGRTHLVAAEGSFHGRTMGALALTAKQAYREPFEPLPGHVSFVPYGDSAALASAVTDETAAVVLEPIQGEAGVVVPPDGYLADARRFTSDHGALLWLDEVQTGIGRTGAWFAAATDPQVAPDVVTVAKGLGGGIPIGACVGLGAAADLLQPGHHGTTFGGNPVACAAALATMDFMRSHDLAGAATRIGEQMTERLGALQVRFPAIGEVRGRGAMQAIELVRPGTLEPDPEAARTIAAACLQAGVVVLTCGTWGNVIRLLPPLTIGDSLLAESLDVLSEAVAATLTGLPLHEES